MAEIKSLKELLGMNLVIPNYQRPYKWETKSIIELLTDIEQAIKDYKKYGKNFKYRIGTIILYKSKNNSYEIVDGQQRIISTTLLNLCINSNFEPNILEQNFSNKFSIINIKNNFNTIKEWFSLKSNETKNSFIEAIENILEVVVITIDSLPEAFQLFDSQNTRGKSLDPHDILKAYHLREMKDNQEEMKIATIKWEQKRPEEIKNLFDKYLFRILNWSKGRKSGPFTIKDIDVYKGIQKSSTYTYAERTQKSMPIYQLSQSFISGNDFFEMVDYYLEMKTNIENELKNNKDFKLIYQIYTSNNDSVGFSHAKNLFLCALMCYYDRFNNLETLIVKKLFVWAFMIRLDMKSLGFDTINKYAIGEYDPRNNDYSNTIPMFSNIIYTRNHYELSSLQLKVRQTPKSDKWENLCDNLKNIMGA